MESNLHVAMWNVYGSEPGMGYKSVKPQSGI